ncbi:hypothetical protein [Microcoleus sp. FACHB-672]|uniref:hypothetical protein n=1 Tax=Microcoleus sp. FACHB-672 TaxID=2692825 RepID=UPI001687D074|nr:hypothetical protein [Microcoleus sp. FACHB-672]MBD2042398.1 hypothetical protein [Microcoleus sp. FACHB-672]
MVGNLNLKNRILIARDLFKILATVLAEGISTSTIQVLDGLKNIQPTEKALLQESDRLLGIGKITQTLECYLIAKYKEFLRNDEQAFYKRRRGEAQIDVLIEQPLSLLNPGAASQELQLNAAGINSRIIEKLPKLRHQIAQNKSQLLHSSADVQFA